MYLSTHTHTHTHTHTRTHVLLKHSDATCMYTCICTCTFVKYSQYSLLLAGRASLLVADLVTRVRQVDLGVGVRQTVGDELQLQVLIVLRGTGRLDHRRNLTSRSVKLNEAGSVLPVSSLRAPSPAGGGTDPP